MDEEIGGAEVRRYSEVGFTCRYRESLRVDSVGDCFYSVGQAKEGAVEAFEVPVLDRGDSRQDLARAGSVSFCQSQILQKNKGELAVITERVHW